MPRGGGGGAREGRVSGRVWGGVGAGAMSFGGKGGERKSLCKGALKV